MGLFDGKPLTREEMIEVEEKYAQQQRAQKSRGALVTKSKPTKSSMVESKPITIAYQVKGKPTTLVVDAEIIGPLAVHPTVNEHGLWTLTHVRTGHAISRFFSSNLEAVIIARKIAAHVGWSGTLEEIKANASLKRDVSVVLRVHGFTVQRDS